MLHYITIATKPNDVLEKIKEKIQENGEEIKVLGEEEDRYIGWNARGNFGVKLKEVYNFVQDDKLDEMELVLFTDAYDVVYYGRFDEILRRYEEMKIPILFGSETECNPKPELAGRYKEKEKEFAYLNSGLFIGRVKELRECMKGYEYNDKHDDQLFWTYKLLENPDKIKLDYENRVFLNTHGIDENELVYANGRVYYKGKEPSFVHVNGMNKSLVNILINNKNIKN
tara:strand:- start:200 stop:880 length:681 start_codon:yes stop_codon:yes gene_type:complete